MLSIQRVSHFTQSICQICGGAIVDVLYVLMEKGAQCLPQESVLILVVNHGIVWSIVLIVLLALLLWKLGKGRKIPSACVQVNLRMSIPYQ